MSPILTRIMLALALLLSQTVVAVHDIDCLGEEHDEHTCEVYYTQDHSAHSVVVFTRFERATYQEVPDCVAAQASPDFFVQSYPSRAPPQRI